MLILMIVKACFTIAILHDDEFIANPDSGDDKMTPGTIGSIAIIEILSVIGQL